MRIPFLLIASMAVIGGVQMTSADEFYEYPDPVDSVVVIYPDDIGGAFWPESNLIQGPGIGFEEDEPHDKIGGAAAANWVTTADCGFPADYIECIGMPIIELDLGSNVVLDEISTWGYEDTNTNGMREFSLRFATDAEGKAGFGTSITYNPTFIVEEFDEFLAFERRSFEFSQQVSARYVELTATDNYFDDPGDGSGENGWGPGGDRVGIGEIAFRIPEVIQDPCDFDGDGALGLGDVNLLLGEIASGDNNLAYDVNGNGAVNTSDLIAFVTREDKLHTYMGDSDLDGEFNSGDLVNVFQGGLFETGQPALWQTGDWNADGVFGSGDLVTAFQDGGFEQGPRWIPPVAVPEPSSLVLILFAGVCLMRTRDR